MIRSTCAALLTRIPVLTNDAFTLVVLTAAVALVSYLPLPASSALLTTRAAEAQGAYLSTQASLIMMAAYAVSALAAAAVTLHRRDA